MILVICENCKVEWEQLPHQYSFKIGCCPVCNNRVIKVFKRKYNTRDINKILQSKEQEKEIRPLLNIAHKILRNDY